MEVKNPFSIYDFLGYLFPGGLALLILFAIYKMIKETGTILPFDYHAVLKFLISPKDEVNLTKILVPFILLSYILGHMSSYLSSITIEYITNRFYMYPSKYLLNIRDGKTPKERLNEEDSVSPKLKKRILWVLKKILFPIVVIPFNSKLFNAFITRPLEPYLVNNINKKIKDLFKELNMEGDYNECDDFHRLVMHYVHLNMPASNRKADNYIALYGFLRATTLIMVLFTDFIIVTMLLSIFVNFGQSINWSSVMLLISCWLISIICYMGYIKFYRRFTQENLMSLLTGKWHD